jgi:uncharacterized SAM-binding protein YcdF (DUF218 family)
VKQTTKPPAFIVCLGAGLRHRKNRAKPRDWIGDQTRLRAKAAALVWQKEPKATVIFSGGRSDPNGPSEAEAMRDFVMQKPWNIPSPAIQTENNSIDTADNVRRVITMIGKEVLATKHITLIAGRRHIRRATRYFRAYGIEVRPVLPCHILGMEPEYVSPHDMRQETLLSILQIIDRKGRIPTMIKRSLRKF